MDTFRSQCCVTARLERRGKAKPWCPRVLMTVATRKVANSWLHLMMVARRLKPLQQICVACASCFPGPFIHLTPDRGETNERARTEPQMCTCAREATW